jgi:hypothetical protein
MDTTQNGRGTPRQVGEYITEQKMDLIRFGEDAKPSRRNAETSGRETKPSKCLNNKVWRGRQTKQEERRDKREGYETEQMLD